MATMILAGVEWWAGLSAVVNMVLAALMVVLTVAIAWQTKRVTGYAKQTLKVTQESLDFFTKPVVGITAETCVLGVHGPDTYRTIASTTLHLVNESPRPIRIEGRKQTSVRNLVNKSSASARNVSVSQPNYPMRTDSGGQSWPLILNHVLFIPVQFSLQPDAELPRENMEVAVEVSVDYVYRGRPFNLTEEITFKLTPHEG